MPTATTATDTPRDGGARAVGDTAFRVGNALYKLAADPSGGAVYAVGRDLHLRRIDLQSGRSTLDVVHSEMAAEAVAVSADGSKLATGDRGDLFILDSKGKAIHEIDTHASYVKDVAFSPDGTKLAVASQDELPSRDQRIALVDVASGSLTVLSGKLESKATRDATSVAWAVDGERFFTGTRGGDVSIWKADGTHERTWSIAGKVTDIAVDPAGRALIGTHLGPLWLDPDASKREQALVDIPIESSVDRVALWKGGQRYALLGRGKLTVFDGANNKPLWSHEVDTNWGRALAFVKPNRIVVGDDERLTVLDSETGKVVAGASGHEGPVVSVAMLGDKPVTAEADRLLSWTGDKFDVLPDKGSFKQVVALDAGGMLALRRHQLTFIAGSGKRTQVKRGNASSFIVAASAKDIVAVADEDGHVQVFNTKGVRQRTLDGGDDQARCVAVAPDGKTIAWARDKLYIAREGASATVTLDLGLRGCVMTDASTLVGVAGFGTQTLVRVDTTTAKVRKDLKVGTHYRITALAAHEGRVFATFERAAGLRRDTKADVFLRSYDAASMKPLETYRGPTATMHSLHIRDGALWMAGESGILWRLRL